MNNYIVFYRGQQKPIVASSAYEASRVAAALFGVPKAPWKVAVVLADKPVSTASL